VVNKNLALALPQADHAHIASLSHQHTGMAALETAWLWFRGVRAFDQRLHIEGAEHIDAALATGRGVILLQAHFTLIDLCGAFIGERWPVSAVYDPPKNPLFSVLQARFRRRTLTAVIPNGDIRNMVRRLRRGEMVWFSPDQAVSERRGGIPKRGVRQDLANKRDVLWHNALAIAVQQAHSNGAGYTPHLWVKC